MFTPKEKETGRFAVDFVKMQKTNKAQYVWTSWKIEPESVNSGKGLVIKSSSRSDWVWPENMWMPKTGEPHSLNGGIIQDDYHRELCVVMGKHGAADIMCGDALVWRRQHVYALCTYD